MPKPEPSSPRPSGRSRLNTYIAVAAIAGGLLYAIGFSIARKPKPGLEIDQPVFEAEWTRLPTPEAVALAYPPKAKAERYATKALVQMNCVANEQGGLEGCAISHETPPGLGFGAAALSLSKEFRLKTETRDGASLVGLPVSVPLGFDPIFAPGT